MQRKYTVLIAFILLSNYIKAENQSDLFQNGVKLYKSGIYNEALKEFKKIESEGYFSVELYKNIAASHYRLQQYPEAILYYEKGLKLSPNDNNLKTDLNVVRSSILGLKPEVPPFIVVSLWLKFSGILSEIFWLMVSLVELAGLAFLLYLWLFRKEKYSPSRLNMAALIVSTVFIIALMAAWTRYSLSNDNTRFILITQNSALKEGPDDQSPELDSLVMGQTMRVSDYLANWVEVILPDGSSGWVKKEILTQI